MKINKSLGIILAVFLIGGITGYLLSSYTQKPDQFKEIRGGGYRFINPLYECTNVDFKAGEYNTLRKRLTDYIDEAVLQNDVERIAVYFRDLNNGPWFGINEDYTFSPASLLKIPIMMAFFKKAESDPSVLSKKIKYEEEIIINANPVIEPENPIVLGQEYTVRELIERLIIESDNIAGGLLVQNIQGSDIDKISSDLDLPISYSASKDYMNVGQYSALFRILYNDSYLDTKYSEMALEILSRSRFKDGLRKNIPQDVPVAHKFGERHVEGTDRYQLHDCGIVYYIDRPYLLCVMSEGHTYNSLIEIIQHIGQEVFKEYNNRYKSY
jgi:beta-lactamase class A